jgi:hypothetical protein
MVCEQDSSGLQTTSEALAGAGEARGSCVYEFGWHRRISGGADSQERTQQKSTTSPVVMPAPKLRIDDLFDRPALEPTGLVGFNLKLLTAVVEARMTTTLR